MPTKKGKDEWDNEGERKSAVQLGQDSMLPMEDKVFGSVPHGRRQMKSTQPRQRRGQLVNVYEMKAAMGTAYHVLGDKRKLVEEPVIVKEGDFLSIGGTAVIDRQMQNIKVGQKIGLNFIEEKASKTKGFSPAKVVKVYAPKNEDGSPQMDEEVQNEANVAAF